MSYFIRFFVIDETPLTLEQIHAGLREADPAFRVNPEGHLHRGDAVLAELEINAKGNELFDEELEEFLEMVADAEGKRRADVEAQLQKAHSVIAAHVLWEDRSAEQTLELLSPLWTWLASNRRGLLQVDDEGFYDGETLILELDD